MYKLYAAMNDSRQAGNTVLYDPKEYTKMQKQEEKVQKKQQQHEAKLVDLNRKAEIAEAEQRLRNALK